MKEQSLPARRTDLRAFLVNTAQGRDLLFESLQLISPDMPQIITDSKKSISEKRLFCYVLFGVITLYAIIAVTWYVSMSGGL
jgi:hypothetical protein